MTLKMKLAERKGVSRLRRTPAQEVAAGPRGAGRAKRRRLKESNDSHPLTKANPKGLSNGRDSRFGLARPLLA
jgi:hypothetical protein